MDDDRLRRLFAARRTKGLDGTPSFGSVVHRPGPRRTLRPLVVAAASACLLLVVALWPRDAPAPASALVSAGELMAWQAPTDVLLDFDLGTDPVLEEGRTTP